MHRFIIGLFYRVCAGHEGGAVTAYRAVGGRLLGERTARLARGRSRRVARCGARVSRGRTSSTWQSRRRRRRKRRFWPHAQASASYGPLFLRHAVDSATNAFLSRDAYGTMQTVRRIRIPFGAAHPRLRKGVSTRQRVHPVPNPTHLLICSLLICSLSHLPEKSGDLHGCGCRSPRTSIRAPSGRCHRVRRGDRRPAPVVGGSDCGRGLRTDSVRSGDHAPREEREGDPGGRA